MSIRKVQLHLISKKYLKFFERSSSNACDKKIIVCDKAKKCSKPDIDAGPAVKEKKDICVYSPCPSEPCPIEPCVADLPSPEFLDPAKGIPSKNDASIVVVGAGVAGLSCAQRLIQAGFKKTLVLEAEDRPGGRINSGWLNDTVIEKGSDWCCETCSPFKNDIVQLGVKNGDFKIPLSGVDPSQGLLLQSDCTPLPLPIGYMAYSHIAEIIKEVKCLIAKIPSSQSDLADAYLGIRVHQLLKKLPGDMAMVCARVLLGLTSFLSPTQRKVISDSFGAYATGANLRIPLGYLGALAPLISDISPERILYKKQVLNIRWGTVLPEQHPRAILKCRDGSTYEADYVVVAFPLGVLKRSMDNMFCPPLSPAKTNAISSLNVGHIGKIFMEYDQPFWVWREKRIQNKWKSGELSKRSNFTRGMTGLEELLGSEHVLMATIKGSAVEEMEKSTDKEVIDHLTGFLKEWSGDDLIPLPKSIVRTNWATNLNFKGAYSYLSGDSEYCLTDAIKVPLPGGCTSLPPILYFAGEHTAARELLGTVKGAMISGIREAELVISAINQTAFEPHPCELVATC